MTLALAFARQWPSFLQGLQHGHLHRTALCQLYCAHVPWTPGQRLVLALDTTSILRPQSPTARDRMAVHAANLPEGAKPIGIGWQFSLRVVTPDPPSSATFVLDPRLQGCDKLVRLQTHRVFYRQPPMARPPPAGRTPMRGRAVTVRAWAGLAYASALDHPVTLLECARQEGKDTKHDPRVIWLLWDSRTEAAPLSEIPNLLYPRRFSIEHGIRFDKQALLWEAPRLRTGAFQRWTDLVMAAHNTLVLARPLCDGRRLPWETRAPLTLQHVRRALAEILPRLGSLVPPPQPRGKSPGRAPGHHPEPAKRFAIVWKGRPAPAHAPPILA